MSQPATSTLRVGVEICANRLHAAAVNAAGEVASTRTSPVIPGDDRLAGLCELIESMTADGKVAQIGLAVPGLVDRETGKVRISDQMPEHAELDIVKVVQDSCGVSAHVENDANAAAYGEYRLGAGRGADDMFYATLGAGVGGAFILGGKIWRGASGFAGELGHVPINSEGMKLEEVASAANIIRRTRMRFHTDSTSSLNKLGEEEITLDAIIKAASEDDDFAQMMLQRTGTYVGSAVASVINLLNPERIVIGGDIMAANETVLESIVSRAQELAFEPAFRATTIVVGELGPYAAAAGAALLANESSSN